MPTRSRSRSGCWRGHRVQGVDLVVEHRTGQVAVHRPLELRPAARRAPPVHHDHREALVGEPLAGQVRGAGGQHALRVRPAVGVQQHRQRAARSVPGGQQQRGAQLPGRRGEQRDPRRQPGRLGVGGDRQLTAVARARTVVAVPSVSRSWAAITRVPPASRPLCTPGFGVCSVSQTPPGAAPGVQPHRARVGAPAEQHGVAVHVEHAADLQPRRGHRARRRPPAGARRRRRPW